MLRERLVRVSNSPMVDLFVAEAGDGAAPTLLVIHGGPDWDQSYLHEPLVQLQDRHRVVFVDLRGCGRSTRGLPPDAHSPERALRDLVVLIEKHLGQPCDVLGFSYGGLIAQRLALSAPDLVNRLVIASSSLLPVPGDAFDGWDERQARMDSGAAFTPPDVWDDEATRLEAISSAPANIWQLDRLPKYLARLDQIRFSSDWAAAWLAGTLPPAGLTDAPRRLARLGKPMLLLHGRQDMTFPVGLLAPALALIPAARAAVIEEAGHMAHIDQPDAWLAALRAFLDDPATRIDTATRLDAVTGAHVEHPRTCWQRRCDLIEGTLDTVQHVR